MEGGIAQGIGTTLFERMVIDASGAVVNPSFRNYRIPAFADIPRSEIFFADTHDRMVPWVQSPSARHPSFPSAPPWGMRSPTRRAFASTACPSAPTGSFAPGRAALRFGQGDP